MICKLQEITKVIALIPLVSYTIKDGDLDTCYLPPISTEYDHVSVRLAMSMLVDVLDELESLDYFSKCSLEHFMGTIKRYEDQDVKTLLKNPILNRLALISE